MRRSALSSLLVSIALPALAMLAVAAVPAPTKAPPVPLLWKVSDNDNSVYLLGSFHMLRADDYPLSADVDKAFADAEALVFELPPEEMGSPELGKAMIAAAVRTDGKTLDDDLPPDVEAHYDAWLLANEAAIGKAIGGNAQVLQMFEPWFVGLMITIVEAQKQGMESKLGLDMHLANAAKDAGKPARGLESGREQLAFFDGMSTVEQVQMLDESTTGAADGKQELESLHRKWRAGDADALWKEMALETRRKYPALYRRINTDRNDAWVPKVQAMLARPGGDDTLVVVGALHLLGGDGVVEKLRRKGYRVERVCSACK